MFFLDLVVFLFGIRLMNVIAEKPDQIASKFSDQTRSDCIEIF